MREKFTFLTVTLSIISVFLIFATPALAVTSLFSDGFESGDFGAWSSNFGNWDVSSTGAHGGSRKAIVIGNTGPTDDILQKNISTAGYNAISLDYWYKIADTLEAGDHVYVEYSANGGTSWTELFDFTTLPSNTWTEINHSLPANASNNANFQFRFRADLGSGSDQFQLDDIVLSGNGVSASQSTVAANSPITTDGGTSTITVIARDQYNNPISGIPAGNVVISSAPTTGVTIVQPTTATNSSGQTTGSFQSTATGSYTISVTVNGVLLNQQPVIITNAGVGANAFVSASPSATVEADLAGVTVTLAITVTDGHGNIVIDNTPVAISTDLGVLAGSGNTVAGVVTRTLSYNNVGDAHLTFSGLIGSGDTTVHFVDTTNPIITLLGSNPESVEFRGTYVEAGATASDNIDGDITDHILTTGTVDPSTSNIAPDPITKLVGVYHKYYNVSDSSGNAAVEQDRVVNIFDRTNPVIASITSSAAVAGVLKIGDTIVFTLTPSVAEPAAVVTGSYNGQVLAWSTSDGGVTYTATYTVAAGEGDQASPLQISGVTMTDEAGNISDSAGGTDVLKTIDANRPAIISVDSDGQTFNNGDLPSEQIKIIFNENILTAPAVSVDAASQTVTDCEDGDAKTWCFDYTINAGEEALRTIYVSGAQDAAENAMLADNTHTLNVDTIAPILAEVTPVVNPTNDATPDYTFSSTQDGTISYNGSCSSAATSAVSGINTITFNALASGTYADCTITVADPAGNASNILAVSEFEIDLGGPTVELASTVPPHTNASSFWVTATFSEPVTGIDISDVAIVNGHANNFAADSSTVYRFEIIPDIEADVNVQIPSNAGFDAAGNGNHPSTVVGTVYDITPPAVLSVMLKEGEAASDNLVKSGDILTIIVNFSEDMAELPVPQVSIAGSNTLSATDMAKISRTQYKYEFAVGAGDGSATITISNGTDLATNIMAADSSTTFTVDNTLPVIDPHADIVEVANAFGGKIVTFTATASDTHDGTIIPTCASESGLESGDFFPMGTTTVTCNTTDQAGNNAEPMKFDVIVNPDVITHIHLIASPTSLAFGTTSLITVRGEDQYNNTVTNNDSTIAVLSADGGGSLDNTILTLSSGIATANLSKDSVGIVHVTATSEGLDPVSVTVEFTEADVSSPFVQEAYPVNSATGVAVDVAPYLIFSEELNASTVASPNIYLVRAGGSTAIPATVSMDFMEGRQRVIIDPASPLDFATQYYFVVTTGVTDLVGNHATPVATEYSFTTAEDATVLAVTGISAIKTYATADGTYENGWEWTFKVTVPTDETGLQMKFTDWTSSLHTIPVANNIQYSSLQASNGPIEITAADAYGDSLILTGDLDASTAGRQIEITVKARIPVGSSGGSYSTSYGIRATGT